MKRMTRKQLEKSIADTTELMKEAAKNLDFLAATPLRVVPHVAGFSQWFLDRSKLPRSAHAPLLTKLQHPWQENRKDRPRIVARP